MDSLIHEWNSETEVLRYANSPHFPVLHVSVPGSSGNQGSCWVLQFASVQKSQGYLQEFKQNIVGTTKLYLNRKFVINGYIN